MSLTVKRALILIALVVGITLIFGLIGGCAKPAPPAAKEALTWDFVTVLGASHPLRVESYDPLLAEVEKNTGGSLKFRARTAPLPGIQNQQLAQCVGNGTIVGVAEEVASYLSVDCPPVALLTVPFLFTTVKDFQKSIDVARDFISKKLIEKYGVFPLWIGSYDQMLVWSKVPLKSLDDLKGKRIRVYDPSLNDWAVAVGAIPVSVAPPDIYDAFQKGVIDVNMSMGPAQALIFKFYEVAKYAYEGMWFTSGAWFMAANKKSFDQLPKDVQSVLKKSADKYEKVGWDVTARITQEGIETCRKNGMAVETWSPESVDKARQVAKQVLWDKYIQTWDAGQVAVFKDIFKALGKKWLW